MHDGEQGAEDDSQVIHSTTTPRAEDDTERRPRQVHPRRNLRPSSTLSPESTRTGGIVIGGDRAEDEPQVCTSARGG